MLEFRISELAFQLRINDDLVKILLDKTEVSVDVHDPRAGSKSWAVISIEGEKTVLIKFIDLGKSDIQQIATFLRNFDRRKIDATPDATGFLRIDKNRRR